MYFKYAVAATALFFGAGGALADTISPLTFEADLAMGESVTITKTVVIEASGPSDALIDVHFLIDTSGSMGGQVNAAKAAASALFTSLESSFGDVAASVGVFSELATLTSADPRDNAIIGGGLTTDNATFTSNVNTVTLCEPDCGGDFPESGYTGIALSGDNLAWRPGSNRFMFVFTDASAKGDLAGAIATLADNDITLVTLAYNGGFSSVNGSYGAPLGGTVYTSSTSAAAIIADVTAGITAGFASYSSVTVDDLGGGDPAIDVSAVCTGADIGACSGAFALGDYDRSIDRTFTFDVTFTRTGAGTKEFTTYAIVDKGIVARERDRFPGDDMPPVPLPAAGWMMIAGLGGLAAIRRRKKAA